MKIFDFVFILITFFVAAGVAEYYTYKDCSSKGFSKLPLISKVIICEVIK